ncbi:hypothetical protein D9M69_654070 [compost metagenome]
MLSVTALAISSSITTAAHSASTTWTATRGQADRRGASTRSSASRVSRPTGITGKAVTKASIQRPKKPSTQPRLSQVIRPLRIRQMVGMMVNRGTRRRQRKPGAGDGAGVAGAEGITTEVFMRIDLVDNINTITDLVDFIN